MRVLIPLLDENINLPSTTRMNAAYTAVSLSQQAAWGSEAVKGALSDALGVSSEDDDRYVAAASVEALKWLTLVNTTAQLIRPIGAEGLNRRPPTGACRLFRVPGFRLAAR